MKNFQNMGFRFLLGVCALLSNTSFDTQNAEKQPPNIVWIVSEDNSKHYMKLFDDNGVETPNIAALAKHGILFDHAFSNAPVCSVARSTIISGCYAPRTGTQYHRRTEYVPMPDSLRMFPAYLRNAGYYTVNNSKEDYNFTKGDDVWDVSSKKGSWKNRKKGQPFFYVHNIGTTHESSVQFSETDMEAHPTRTKENSFKVQPNHPDTELFRYTNAYYRDRIMDMDKQVGEVVEALKADGLLENTFIFYYGDHGGVLPGSKGYVYETGLHVPMVVRIPEKYKDLVDKKMGSRAKRFVSFVDLAPTVLDLAGIKVPKQMDGRPFLGKNIDLKALRNNNVTYGYADRFDEKYDLVRSVRKGKYKYIRSFQPFNVDALMNNYRYKQLAYREWKTLYREGKLNETQSAFFKPRAPEMLFDVEKDPYETKNLAQDPEMRTTLKKMHSLLNTWIKEMPDLSLYPEFYLVDKGFDNPVKFGRERKNDINGYIDTADLMLKDFGTVKERIRSQLKSKDPWQRYWALIVCSSFGEKAKTLVPMVKEMAKNDPEAINRVRAAEFLGLIKVADPAPVMLSALYGTDSPTKALLILNCMALLGSDGTPYTFDIDTKKMKQKVLDDEMVTGRLDYLLQIKP